MISHGPETWHPDGEQFFQPAAGPLLDMGPYYATALVNLLGRCKSVTGMARRAFDKRPKLAEPRYGTMIDVKAPTFCNALLEFDSGVTAHMLLTFDVYHTNGAVIEIYGTEGTLFVPDPNNFSGKLTLMRGYQDSADMAMLFPYTENSRALGLADMAKAIQTGRAYRANSQQQLHVAELLTSIITSSDEGKTHVMESAYERRAPMKSNGVPGILD